MKVLIVGLIALITTPVIGQTYISKDIKRDSAYVIYEQVENNLTKINIVKVSEFKSKTIRSMFLSDLYSQRKTFIKSLGENAIVAEFVIRKTDGFNYEAIQYYSL